MSNSHRHFDPQGQRSADRHHLDRCNGIDVTTNSHDFHAFLTQGEARNLSRDGEPEPCKVDDTLRTLNPLGRYQLRQVFIACLGVLSCSYQLLGNIFVGGKVGWHQCAAPDNSSTLPSHLTHLDWWNSSQVSYGQCQITVSRSNLSDDIEVFPCLFGHNYGSPRERSFRTEFDLVCNRKILGGLAQTSLIIGQGVGALSCSFPTDRFGRKKTVIASQTALTILGLAAGFAPSFPVFAVLKFAIGAAQQGVATSLTCLTVESFPAERRSIQSVIGSTLWGLSCCSLTLPAFFLRHHGWRTLQWAISLIPVPVLLFGFWYMDESLRWLVANDRKKAAESILKRAARVNHKDFDTVLNTLEPPAANTELGLMTDSGTKNGDGHQALTSQQHTDVTTTPVMTTEHVASAKLNLIDLYRHRRLFINASIMWISWFTCAFSFFGLYMMSTSLHGNRFLNYFLTALMETFPGLVFYFLVDRVGRKWAVRPFFIVAGIGLVSSGVCRIFTGNSALMTLSVVAAMLGMVGASGMFGALFFFTPELFPTNMRSQSLGLCSLVGRLGGMLAPFMTDLADVAVWAPGALIGSLCFVVVIIMHFLPETKGRQLPNSVEDVEEWHRKKTKEEELHNM